MTTVIYKVAMANYGSKDDVVLSLNDLSNISAEFKSTGIGKGEIHISFSNQPSFDDVLAIGAYIGQIETMQLL